MAIQLEPINAASDWGNEAGKTNNNNQKLLNGILAVESKVDTFAESVQEAIDKADNINKNSQGYKSTIAKLKSDIPNPESGWYAYVGETGTIWEESNGQWVNSGRPIPEEMLQLEGYAKKVNEEGDNVVYAPNGIVDVRKEFTKEIKKYSEKAIESGTIYDLLPKEVVETEFPHDNDFSVLSDDDPNGNTNILFNDIAYIEHDCYLKDFSIKMNVAGSIMPVVLQKTKEHSDGSIEIKYLHNYGTQFVSAGVNNINLLDDYLIPAGSYIGVYRSTAARIASSSSFGVGYYANGINTSVSVATKWDMRVAYKFATVDIKETFDINILKTMSDLLNNLVSTQFDTTKKETDVNKILDQRITNKGKTGSSDDNFIGIIDVTGAVTVNLQVFASNAGWGGSFYDANEKHVGGYNFKVGEVVNLDRKTVDVPKSATTLKFTASTNHFDYVILKGKFKKDNLSTPTNIILPDLSDSLLDVVFNDNQSTIKQFNNSILVKTKPGDYSDRLYLKGDWSRDFELSFNFESDNRSETNTSISLDIQASDGTLLSIRRYGKYLLRLVENDTATLISNKAFESLIQITKNESEISITIGDDNITKTIGVKSICFTVKGATANTNTYYIANLQKNTASYLYQANGLHLTQYQAISRYNNIIVFGYYGTDKKLNVSVIDVEKGATQNKKIDSIVIGSDAHNYIAVSVDSLGGVHIACNCHATPLYYLYCPHYSNINDLAISNKLVSSNATYPEFVRTSDNELYFTIREGASGSSINIFFKYDTVTKTFTRTTTNPVTDGTNGKGGTSYFGKWIFCDGWFYNVWCWRTTGNVNTNNQINLIKTQDFVSFYGYKGDLLVLPISRSSTPSYCLENIPENSGLINQWYIVPFTFQNKVHVWYMKYDENGISNIYLLYPQGDVYKSKKVTQFNYKYDIAANVDVILDVYPFDLGDYLRLDIKHKHCGNNSYYFDCNYNMVVQDYANEKALIESSYSVQYELIDNVNLLFISDKKNADGAVYKNGVIEIY